VPLAGSTKVTGERLGIAQARDDPRLVIPVVRSSSPRKSGVAQLQHRDELPDHATATAARWTGHGNQAQSAALERASGRDEIVEGAEVRPAIRQPPGRASPNQIAGAAGPMELTKTRDEQARIGDALGRIGIEETLEQGRDGARELDLRSLGERP